MKTYWFKRKKYGWGWGLPATWQGWIVLFVYAVSALYVAWHFDQSDIVVESTILFIVLTVLFLIIVFITGESPKWQWGDTKKN